MSSLYFTFVLSKFSVYVFSPIFLMVTPSLPMHSFILSWEISMGKSTFNSPIEFDCIFKSTILPSKIISPLFSTITLEHNSSISFKSWVVSKKALPSSFIYFINFLIFCLIETSMPIVGSSKIISFGLYINIAAKSHKTLCPKLSFLTGLCNKLSNPKKSFKMSKRCFNVLEETSYISANKFKDSKTAKSHHN